MPPNGKQTDHSDTSNLICHKQKSIWVPPFLHTPITQKGNLHWTCHLPVRQRSPVHPSSHPFVHRPVSVEHGTPSLQCPQSNAQFGPYLYGIHPRIPKGTNYCYHHQRRYHHHNHSVA